MVEIEPGNSGTLQSARFKANLRLWSDVKPLGELIHVSRQQWVRHYAKGQTIPEEGRAQNRISLRHYASSETIESGNIKNIPAVLSKLLDDFESKSTAIFEFTRIGEVEAVLWVAIIGYDPVDVPDLSETLVKKAKGAGVKILMENYTVMDKETGNPAKTWIALD